MIKFRKLPEDVHEKISLLTGLFEKDPDIIFAYLFGGLARTGVPQPLSDVDIAIYLSDEANVIDEKMDILGVAFFYGRLSINLFGT